jgi:streptogramin lyase
VHRDVKPANVLLAEGDHVYLADFGLSKQVSSISGLTATGQFVGTVDYVAPEQVQGEAVDGRTDQYALGCVLYECLTGEPPFPRSSSIAVLWAHVEDEPPSLTAARPDLPETLDGVVTRSLAKAPGDRYGSCRELVAAAREALAPEAPAVSEKRSLGPLPTGPPASRRRRRLSRLWLLTGLVALLVAAAVAAVLVVTLGGDGAAAVVVPNSLVRIDPETNEITEVASVGNWPEQVAVAGDYVFVVNYQDATLSRLDTGSGDVQTFGGATSPITVAAEDENAIWVGSNTEPEIVRVDAVSLEVERRVALEGVAATWMAIGDGLLWVTDFPAGASCPGPQATSQVDAASGRVVRRVETGRCPIGVAYGEGAAWVVNQGDSTVMRIDPADGALRTFDTGYTAGDVTTGFGSVWTTSLYDGAIWRLNANTGSPQGIVTVCESPWDVVAGHGSVWVTCHRSEDGPGGALKRIDPETNTVVATIELGHYANSIAVTRDDVWVAVAATDLPD